MTMQECARGEEAVRVIPLNRAGFAQPRAYPQLRIDGVYRASFAMGLTVYALPSPVASTHISRHRARLTLRHAREALRALDVSGAEVLPRMHDPIHPVCIRQARHHPRKQP